MRQNALTIDVEDYFQVAALAEAVNRDDWPTMEYRVEANTERLLELQGCELFNYGTVPLGSGYPLR